MKTQDNDGILGEMLIKEKNCSVWLIIQSKAI